MDDYLESPMEDDVFPCKGCGEVNLQAPNLQQERINMCLDETMADSC